MKPMFLNKATVGEKKILSAIPILRQLPGIQNDGYAKSKNSDILLSLRITELSAKDYDLFQSMNGE